MAKRLPRFILAIVAAAALVAILESRPDTWLKSSRLPVQVQGAIRHGEQPLTNATVTLDAQGNLRAAEAELDTRGRFSTSLPMPGDYLLTVGTASGLTSTSREITLEEGANDLVVDLPPSLVTVSLKTSTGPLPDLVQLILVGPSSEFGSERVGFVTRDDGWTGTYVGIGFGRYTLVAFANGSAQQPTLTSAQPAAFVLSREAPVANIQLELVSRKLELKIQDSDRRPVEYAEVHSSRYELPRMGSDIFDARGVPTGQEILVLAPGLLPVCTTAQSSGVQVVTLPKKTKSSTELVLRDGPGRPVGLLSGLPGSNCAVPIRRLDPDWLPRGPRELVLTIRGLPRGRYGYRPQPDVEAVDISVPGDPTVYTVPSTCRFCGK